MTRVVCKYFSKEEVYFFSESTKKSAENETKGQTNKNLKSLPFHVRIFSSLFFRYLAVHGAMFLRRCVTPIINRILDAGKNPLAEIQPQPHIETLQTISYAFFELLSKHLAEVPV